MRDFNRVGTKSYKNGIPGKLVFELYCQGLLKKMFRKTTGKQLMSKL